MAARTLPSPITRADVAREVGIDARLAAFHLDKLVAAGFLKTKDVPRGASSPRGGRPPKRYAPSSIQVDLTIPERRYDVVAGILARAVDELGVTSRVRSAALAEARRTGREAGRSSRSLVTALRELGYNPARLGRDLVLRNCPFHDVVIESRRTVCALNQALIQGVLEALGVSPDTAELSPRPGHCCVRIKGGRGG